MIAPPAKALRVDEGGRVVAGITAPGAMWPIGIYHAHLVRECFGLLQGAKITDEAGAERVWPADADLKPLRPRRGDSVGEHPPM
jgi:hypothetical protein